MTIRDLYAVMKITMMVMLLRLQAGLQKTYYVVLKTFWQKGSLHNSPISVATYQNQHVAMDDDLLQSFK